MTDPGDGVAHLGRGLDASLLVHCAALGHRNLAHRVSCQCSREHGARKRNRIGSVSDRWDRSIYRHTYNRLYCGKNKQTDRCHHCHSCHNFGTDRQTDILDFYENRSLTWLHTFLGWHLPPLPFLPPPCVGELRTAPHTELSTSWKIYDEKIMSLKKVLIGDRCCIYSLNVVQCDKCDILDSIDNWQSQLTPSVRVFILDGGFIATRCLQMYCPYLYYYVQTYFPVKVEKNWNLTFKKNWQELSYTSCVLAADKQKSWPPTWPRLKPGAWHCLWRIHSPGTKLCHSWGNI